MNQELLAIITKIINTNAFCSLSRDSELVMELRALLVSQGYLERTDAPYVGCVREPAHVP